MHDWHFFSELRHLVQRDAGGRGLDRVAGRSLFSVSGPDLEPACRGLAGTRRLEAAIVTGFYIPHAECYETDGPLGAVFLAEVLHQLGAGVTILSEAGCCAVMEIALRLNGLEDHVRLHDLPSPGTPDIESWVQTFWKQHEHLTHLIAVERAGPSHTLASLMQQYGQQPAPVGDFVKATEPAGWDRAHSMRGHDLTAFTAPAHRLFETMPRHVATLGVADGGNEIGMGRIPWDILHANIALGGKIACRVPTTRLIVAGTSNWGAYALAAGTAWLRGRQDLSRLFDSDRESQLWEATMEKEPLVDGITAASQLSVDGIAWNAYRLPMEGMQQLLERGRSQDHGVQRFPSVHG